MSISRKFIVLMVFLASCFCADQLTSALASQASGSGRAGKPLTPEELMFQPADLFPEFPEIKWGMRFSDARTEIEKTGARPVGFGSTQTELAWDGEFNRMHGRGTVLFKQGAGVYQIAVLVYARETRSEIFQQWAKEISAKHGKAEEEDSTIAISRVWKLTDGFAIELRLIKDDDSPVVDVRRVRE